MIRITLVKEAAYFAISAHGNQTYDGFPYYYHLEEVVDVLKEFGFTEDKYVMAGYLHDVLEDTAVSYNELGRNRLERKTKTLPKIKESKDRIIVKLADRIANMRNSTKKGHRMGSMYVKEYAAFRTALYFYAPDLIGMWKDLDCLINEMKE